MIPSKDDSNISQRVQESFAQLIAAATDVKECLDRIKGDPLDVRLIDELVSNADHLMMMVQQYRGLMKDAAAMIFATLSEQDG